MRAGAVQFDKEADWWADLEHELLVFPRGKHDDMVDAIAYLGLMIDKIIEAPTREEIAEIEYEDELEQSDLNLQGKSEICGY
jgi:phage terminase large subunit-like protein